MRHHQRDAALREAVERRRLRVGRALREDEADELVVALDVRLLAGGVGVAVEHGSEPAAVGVELDPGGVGELRAVVRYQKFLITDIIRNLALSGISDAA